MSVTGLLNIKKMAASDVSIFAAISYCFGNSIFIVSLASDNINCFVLLIIHYSIGVVYASAP